MQRLINILVVILVLFSLYFGIIVDYRRVQDMQRLLESDVELVGHIRVIDEDYRRLFFIIEGRGTHISRIQNDIVNLRTGLQREYRTIFDDLATYIQSNNRTILDMQEVTNRLEENLKVLDEQVNPPEDRD